MNLYKNSYPQLVFDYSDVGYIPNEKECYKLWNKYEMLPNIREHSQLVADFALALCKKINEKFADTVSEDLAYTAGLLHDIAKTYTIKHGGNHQLLGACMIRSETANPYLASCIYHHVIWPWNEGILALENMVFHVPVIIAYADKRVCHNEQVTLDYRFQDLFERYGRTELIREHIQVNYDQAKLMEKFLSEKLEYNLHESIVDNGCLVTGA